MATAENQHQEISSEKVNFKRQVDLFVKHHRKKQEDLEEKDKRLHLSLQNLIDDAPMLSDEAIEVLFQKETDYTVPNQAVNEVQHVLKKMQSRINSLPAKMRFFILETVNFFSSKISIGKLVPALLVLEGEDQKKAICEFVFPTFMSINKNIELLAMNDELFDSKTLHIEKGGLYTFVADIAKLLINLFREEFVAKPTDTNSPLEFLLTTFDPESFRINPTLNRKSEYIYQEMVDNEQILRRTVLKFVVMIQSHQAMYNYSMKRYRYYKLFLSNLTSENRFKGVEPVDMSRILAGCMVANDQYKPNEDLIDDMIDEERFDLEATSKARKDFFNNLSPSNIFRLITRIKISLHHISKIDFVEEFQDVQKYSIKTILNNVWSGFIRLVDKGLSIVTEPIHQIVDQLKKTYESFTNDEERWEDTLADGVLETLAKKAKPIKYIPKNLESFAIMTQHLRIVETDVAAFRGAHEGATQKDFGHNSRLFRKNENLIVNFLHCFQTLFPAFKNNKKVMSISYDKQPKIKEYYMAQTFDNYMICLGLTHLRAGNSLIIEQKDIFPYVLLFSEATNSELGRILSREAFIDNELKIYNEVEITAENAIFFFEPLYLILHHLPEKDWRSKKVQACVAFLTGELQRYKRKGGKFLYCVNVPDSPR